MHSNSPSRRRTFRLACALGLLAVALSLTGCGIVGGLPTNPGYAALGSPGFRDTDRLFAVSFGPLSLGLARFVAQGDARLSTVLAGIEAVRVYDYDVGGDAVRVRTRLEAMRKRLLREGWQQCAAVRHGGRSALALVRMNEHGNLLGIVVVVEDEDTLALFNVIGDVRPAALRALMDFLDVRPPRLEVAHALR